MNSIFKYNYILILFALLSFSACQDELTEVNNPNEQETISPNTVLTTLMSRTTANYGAADDILDNSSCFSLELPVTIIVNNTTIVIESESDLDDLEDFLEDLNEDDNDIDFIFPLTIIFNDYTQVVIENEDQFENFINDCDEEDGDEDVIECVDFVFPISFSVFNASFDFIDTVIIESDQALYVFIEELEENDDAVIVSLNYPVTLIYTNGETIEVNSNEELANAIELAEEDCDDDNDDSDCSQNDILEILLECPWDFTDGTDTFNNYKLIFNSDGSLEISEGNATSAIGGNWNLTSTDNGLVISILELTAFQDQLQGDWLIVDCEDERLEMVQNNDLLILEQNCNIDEDPFDCFSDFQLIECANNNGEAEFNLSADTIGLIDCPVYFLASFHVSEADAENNSNAISNTESYFSAQGEVYLRIEAENGNFEIYTIFLLLEDCNLFECFESFDAIITLCDEENDGVEVFNLTNAFANCAPTADVLTYFETQQDAESNANSIVNAETYTNTEVEQVVYVRVEIENQIEVFPIVLQLEDCSTENCTEADIDAILVTCVWNAVNYNGSDNLAEYNFNFIENSQSVIIYTNTSEIEASWSTSQSSSGVIIEFSNVTGPNIQAISGEWLVMECNEDRLEMHRGEDILVLERNCD